MTRSLPTAAALLCLLAFVPRGWARDPGFAVQSTCRGKAPCARLIKHLKRLKAASRGSNATATKARFVRGSLLAFEAMRVGDKALAARAVEALKPVVAAGTGSRFADDALVLIARLRRQRGTMSRAGAALAEVICHHRGGDQVTRAKALRQKWKLGAVRCSATAKTVTAKPAAKVVSAKATPRPELKPVKPVANAPAKANLGLGPVTASGGKLASALRRVKRIVLDPGHGGDDPGALGRKGVREADLAYDLTVAVSQVLRKRGYQVLLTRGRSEGRTLRQRTEYANRHHADLFISIHLNAARRKAYGFEVYFLDVGADRYARRLAARENRQSEKEVDALRYILADLATKGNAADSRTLAKALTEAVNGFRSNRKKEVRSALFAVLLGARMPAVLIEAGFVTDGDDVKRLKTAKRRQATARFLADGIDAFAKQMAKERR